MDTVQAFMPVISDDDEFHVELQSIQAEMERYQNQFRGKIVFCNCDDPFESYFVKYFLMNFNRLGLNGLVAMGYPTASRNYETLYHEACGLCVTNTRPYLSSGRLDFTADEVEQFLHLEQQHVMWPLQGNLARAKDGSLVRVPRIIDCLQPNGLMARQTVYQNVYYMPGDFRSDVSLEILKRADIVVTAPPSSLISEYLALLIAHKKDFLILCSRQTVLHPLVFPLLKQGRIQMNQGAGPDSSRVSNLYVKNHSDWAAYQNDGYYARLSEMNWFTTMADKSVSGGYDSDIIVDMICRCGGRGKTVFVFYNTGLKYEATLRHLDYLEQRYGIVIKRVKAGTPIPLCCKKYGQPFFSKYVSDMIGRLQRHGFQWEDEPLEILEQKYYRCRSALRWWTNDWGEDSQFSINHVPWLKEFLMAHPPRFSISSTCCEKSKKNPMASELASGGYDLNIYGVRKAEGGKRASAYKSCFSDNWGSADEYRPLFWWSDADKEGYRETMGIVRSDCYEVWGMRRTGCAGCPFAREYKTELALAEQYEPKRYKAMRAVFSDSYAYTEQFAAFRAEKSVRKK